MKAPQLLSGGAVEGGNEAADTVLAAAGTHKNLVLDDERGHRDRVAKLGISDSDVPQGASRRSVDGHEVPVERAQVQGIAENGHATIVGAAAHARVRRDG